MLKKVFMCFVALLAIAAAAAGPVRGQNGNLLTTVTPTSLTTYDETTPGVVNVILDGQLEYDNTEGWQAEYGDGNQGSVSVTAAAGFSIDSCKFYVGEDSYTVTAAPFAVYPYCLGSTQIVTSQPNAQGSEFWSGGVKRIEVYGTAPAQPHTVRMAAGTEEAANWTLASGNASVPGTQVLEGIMSGSQLTATYAGDLKVKEVIATKHPEPTPLTIEALTAGTIVVQQPQSGMQYTLNGGPKTAMTEAPTEITVAVGDKVAFYGNGTSITRYNGTGITGGTAEVKAYGNIMSLVNETGFDTATTLTAINAFYYLFDFYTNLKDISGLKLPATTLTEECYRGMFSYCTGLTTVPTDLLPATTMARGCYSRMFTGCENLTNVPTLPATTLAMGCYDNMFSFCTGLTTVPTNLLPATTLAEGCYSSMFPYCLNLTTAPVLPATTLVGNCYQEMFYSCSKLSSVTCLATSGINQNSSTENWLESAGSDVQGTKTFNAVSTAEWPMNNGNGIPSGWTRQNIDN